MDDHPNRIASSLILGLFALTAACSSTEVRIRTNGAWSSDGTSVLAAETRYDTTDPTWPWYAAQGASNWRTTFIELAPDMSGGTELATIAELDTTQGGGMQSAPMWWLAPQRTVIALEYHQAVAFDLAAGVRRTFDLPSAEKVRLFRRPAIDLSESAGPVAVVPSPDASRVAVFHTAPYLGSGGFTDMRFVHAIAIHSLDGTFERAIALTAWDDTDEDLNLDLPPPVPMLPNPEPGVDAFPPWGFVPVHYNTRLLWTKDSAAVFVVDVDRPDEGDPTALAWRIDVATGAHTVVDEVPAVALATKGGAVSDAGKLLATKAVEGAPNEMTLELHALEGWVAFDDVTLVPAVQATYAR